MAGSSMALHEDRGDLTPATLDRHRGIASLIEELEAIDWYQQRVEATGDPVLEAVLAHNRDEETEHAAMSLEWLRRTDPALDRHLRRHLFTSGAIVDTEEAGEGAGPGDGGGDGDGSLGIGSLRRAER